MDVQAKVVDALITYLRSVYHRPYQAGLRNWLRDEFERMIQYLDDNDIAELKYIKEKRCDHYWVGMPHHDSKCNKCGQVYSCSGKHS